MLASPGRSSGRVLPPSLFPVVPAQRARLGLRRPASHPASRPAAEVETAVHQIFEVPPAPLYVLGSGLPDLGGTVDPDGDGRPRSIGPLGGSGNGVPADPPPAPEPPAAAGGPGRPQPAPRRRPWWRRI